MKLLFSLLILFSCIYATEMNDCKNDAYEWMSFSLDVIRISKMLPTSGARALYLISQAMYDTVTSFSPKIRPYICRIKKHPNFTRNQIKEAIAGAAYTMIKKLFKDSEEIMVMNEKFYEKKTDFFSSASSIGSKCAEEVYESRSQDGSNELGNKPGSKDGKPYSDYTNYTPVNPPQRADRHQCKNMRSFLHWTPLIIQNPTTGEFTTQEAATPHWGRVKTFTTPISLIDSVKPPPFPGSESENQFMEEVDEILEIFSKIGDKEKIIAEFWADGFLESATPAGHWTYITLYMIEKKCLSLIDSVVLLFLQSAACLDTSILVWATKRRFDYARPISLIKCMKENETISTWKGYYSGIGDTLGINWKPYQDRGFITPPFQEYCSGHSAFARSSAEILKSFFGSDDYGERIIIPRGKSLYEPKITDRTNSLYLDGVTNVVNQGSNSKGYSPSSDVVLEWSTFTDAAIECGLSRRYAGVHWRSGDIECRNLGRKIGKIVWRDFLNHQK